MEIQNGQIALILDELSNKVVGYKESHIYAHDIMVEAEEAEILHEAAAHNAEVYYMDGALIKKPKNKREHWNMLSDINIQLGNLQKKSNNLLGEFLCSKSESVISQLKEIQKSKKQKIRKRDKLERERNLSLKEKLLNELKQTVFQYDCSICLIIRDDNEYLEEWLTWHIGQGVQHFYIYDHGSKQPVSEFLRTLDETIRNKVTAMDFSGSHEFAQHEAYNDCLNRYKYESRWIGFIDSDEMVRVKNGKSLPEFLKAFEENAGLFVTWIMYGANGQTEKSALPLRERFTEISPSEHSKGVGKVFVQPILMQRMLTHNGYPAEGFGVVNEYKLFVEDAEAWMPEATAEQICVDHYYTKSYEEWMEKIRRGTCDPFFNRKYEEFFLYNPEMTHCRQTEFPVQEYEISNK